MQFVTDVFKSPVQSLKNIWVIYSVQLVSSYNKISADISNRESRDCHLKMKQAPQADAANAKWLFSRANSRKTYTEKYQSKSQETKSLPKSGMVRAVCYSLTDQKVLSILTICFV